MSSLAESPSLPAGTRPPLNFRPWLAALACFDEIIVEGPRGTTKTTGILAWIYEQMRTTPLLRVLFLRSTRTRLSEGALVTWEQEVLGPGHPLTTGATREHRSKYVLPNGSEAVCGGLDDLARYQSTPWDIIYVNELGEGVTEEQWESLGGSQRARLIPGQAKVWGKSKRIGDINPVAPAHWTNQRCDPFPDRLRPRIGMVEAYPQAFTMDMYAEAQLYNTAPTKAKSKRIVTYHADNLSYFDQDAWQWMPEGLDYAKKQLDKLSGHQRSRWLEGRWRAAEGGVYPEFNEEQHVIEPFAVPKEWPCFLAKDPGRDHPDATVVATVTPLEQIIIVAESCVRNTTTEQDARTIDRLFSPNFRIVRKLGDPHYMFSLTKHSDTGRTIAQQMRDFGHVFEPAPAARNQTEIAQQCDMVRTRLTTIAADGCPMLQVFRTCTNVIRGFQTWSYVRDSKGQIKGGEDKFSDIDDDEMDAVRMIVASNPVHAPVIHASYDAGGYR